MAILTRLNSLIGGGGGNGVEGGSAPLPEAQVPSIDTPATLPVQDAVADQIDKTLKVEPSSSSTTLNLAEEKVDQGLAAAPDKAADPVTSTVPPENRSPFDNLRPPDFQKQMADLRAKLPPNTDTAGGDQTQPLTTDTQINGRPWPEWAVRPHWLDGNNDVPSGSDGPRVINSDTTNPSNAVNETDRSDWAGKSKSLDDQTTRFAAIDRVFDDNGSSTDTTSDVTSTAGSSEAQNGAGGSQAASSEPQPQSVDGRDESLLPLDTTGTATPQAESTTATPSSPDALDAIPIEYKRLTPFELSQKASEYGYSYIQGTTPVPTGMATLHEEGKPDRQVFVAGGLGPNKEGVRATIIKKDDGTDEIIPSNSEIKISFPGDPTPKLETQTVDASQATTQPPEPPKPHPLAVDSSPIMGTLNNDGSKKDIPQPTPTSPPPIAGSMNPDNSGDEGKQRAEAKINADPNAPDPLKQTQEDMQREVASATQDLKDLWDAIDKDDPMFDMIVDAGGIDKFVANTKAFYTTAQGPDNVNSHLAVDMAKYRDAAISALGKDKADQLLQAARNKRAATPPPAQPLPKMDTDNSASGRAQQAREAGLDPNNSIDMNNDNTTQEAQRRNAERAKTTQGTPEAPTPLTAEQRAEKRNVLLTEKKDIMDTLDRDGILSPEQAKRLREINGELKTMPDRVSQLEDIKRRADAGEILSDEDEAILSGAEPEDVTTESQEDIDARNERVLGEQHDEFFKKLKDGDPTAVEPLVNFNREYAKTLGFELSKEGEAEMRAFFKDIMTPEKGKNARRTARSERIKKKLVELGQKEVNLMNIGIVLEKLRANEEKLKEQVNQTEYEYEKETNPQEKIRKLTIYNNRVSALTENKDRTKEQVNAARKIEVDRRQALGYLHRKLGTKSWFQNVAFGLGTARRQLSGTPANVWDWAMAYA